MAIVTSLREERLHRPGQHWLIECECASSWGLWLVWEVDRSRRPAGSARLASRTVRHAAKALKGLNPIAATDRHRFARLPTALNRVCP